MCSVQSLLSAVEDAGFKAAVEENRHQSSIKICELRIHGMVCSACSNGIQNELEKTEGVHAVRIALALGEAEVEFDERKTTIVHCFRPPFYYQKVVCAGQDYFKG